MLTTTFFKHQDRIIPFWMSEIPHNALNPYFLKTYIFTAWWNEGLKSSCILQALLLLDGIVFLKSPNKTYAINAYILCVSRDFEMVFCEFKSPSKKRNEIFTNTIGAIADVFFTEFQFLFLRRSFILLRSEIENRQELKRNFKTGKETWIGWKI